jgi:predicted unusual protein kinase regulating ubiquinone biosynthesis (AarF/ABC1/UbiB family)
MSKRFSPNKQLNRVCFKMEDYKALTVNDSEVIKKVSVVSENDRKPCGEEAFLLEERCLTLLNDNFECICDEQRTHFPKIIDHNDNKLEFRLTHCGTTLAEYHGANAASLPEQPNKARKQIECIIHNLKINKIIHCDIHDKNICIDKDGNLFLIDFADALIGEYNTISEKEWETREKTMIEELKSIGEGLTQ